ncbi:hypothetical protein Tco_0536012 [Tanacetum coccineum]
MNGEVQLQALVDGKKIIITEAFVRRDIQLNDEEDEAFNEEMDDSLEMPATIATSLDAEQERGSGPKSQDTMGDTIVRTTFKNVSKTSNDSLLTGVNRPRSDEDRLKLNELMEFFEKLEKKGGSRTHKLKRLYKVSRPARVISSDEASLGDQEDATKQGRKIDDIDKDAKITLVHETQERYGDDEMCDTGVLNDDEVLAKPEVTIKDAKGPVIHEEVQATTPTVSSQQPSHVKAQDKGKWIMVEEPMKMKKKDQISLDEELAFKLQAEEEEERLAREKAQREEEANIVA